VKPNESEKKKKKRRMRKQQKTKRTNNEGMKKEVGRGDGEQEHALVVIAEVLSDFGLVETRC
jgi:hypothetical protein